MKKTVVLLLMLSFALAGCGQKPEAVKILQPEEAKAKALAYINSNLVDPTKGMTATADTVTEEGGLYKIMVKVGENEIESYVTKDGKKLLAQAFNLDEQQPAAEEPAAPAVSTVNTKKAKPEVELFVMSYCPYGTQIEKGILPVLDVLGSKVDFKLKFCDYVMHDQKESDGNLNQYCIQKDEPAKLKAYLKCFLAAGDSAGCLKSTGINQSKLKSCVAATAKQFDLKYPAFKIYADDVAKYGASGSPTFVVNGEKIQAPRDPASLLQVICSGFETQPEECQAKLASETPAPGFGTGTASGGGNASCN